MNKIRFTPQRLYRPLAKVSQMMKLVKYRFKFEIFNALAVCI